MYLFTAGWTGRGGGRQKMKNGQYLSASGGTLTHNQEDTDLHHLTTRPPHTYIHANTKANLVATRW